MGYGFTVVAITWQKLKNLLPGKISTKMKHKVSLKANKRKALKSIILTRINAWNDDNALILLYGIS